jgi:deoxyribodipyrimidine photo-lyase
MAKSDASTQPDRSGMPAPATLLWLRRDLRLADNPALLAAVDAAQRRGGGLLPVYVWETRGRRRWAPGATARWWLWHSLTALDADLRRRGSHLVLTRGEPAAALVALARSSGASLVVWAAGLEPEEAADDKAVAAALGATGISAHVVPSAALLRHPADVRTRQGRPYTVFGPYWRACLAQGEPPQPRRAPPDLPAPPAAAPEAAVELTSLNDLRTEAVRPWAAGFGEHWTPGEAGAETRLATFLERTVAGYADARDLPSVDGTSRLSPHLHWGELSGCQVWHAVGGTLAEAGLSLEPSLAPAGLSAARAPDLGRSAGAFVRQLGWREFGHHLLHHFPHMTERPLQRRFAAFPWREDPAALAAWQRGRTGHPFVDAGLRELLATGWMHNRTRLVAASFLVKDLLLPWQQGEDWFWETLVDADLANNALGWQWVAGSGADAAPYFRVFNPAAQRRRYDRDGVYLRRWLPELAGEDVADTYGTPLIEHGEARSRALAAYAAMRDATS